MSAKAWPQGAAQWLPVLVLFGFVTTAAVVILRGIFVNPSTTSVDLCCGFGCLGDRIFARRIGFGVLFTWA